jgi:hypothetical protein
MIEQSPAQVGMLQLAWTGSPHLIRLDTRRLGGSSVVVCSTALSRQWNVTRRQVLGLVAAAAGLSISQPDPSLAVCGEPDPDWAHFLSWKGWFSVSDECTHVTLLCMLENNDGEYGRRVIVC